MGRSDPIQILLFCLVKYRNEGFLSVTLCLDLSHVFLPLDEKFSEQNQLLFYALTQARSALPLFEEGI